MPQHPTDRLKIADIAGFDRFTANGKLSPARATVNAALIGNPRGSYGDVCQPVESAAIKALMVTRNVGPFSVTGLSPAVSALTAVMAEVRTTHPDLHDRLGTAGMLCCRLVRGSATAVSNHSWGLAVDLTIDKELDTRGDGFVQRGLLDLWPIFNRHGFYWGIAFPNEDSMHFEASDQMIRRWAAEGAFGAQSGKTIPGALTVGDRGPRVLALQRALNAALAPARIDEDGIFGPMTRLALIDFQRANGLAPDGLANGTVQKRLGI
jgi:hypothetical protein